MYDRLAYLLKFSCCATSLSTRYLSIPMGSDASQPDDLLPIGISREPDYPEGFDQPDTSSPQPEEPTKVRASKSDSKNSARDPSAEEIGYRFPYGRVAIEPVPDTSGAFGTAGTFAVRAVWHRGKAVLPLFESTALRPIAMVTLGGHRFPVFLSQHSRKKRERIIFGGKRKTAKSPRCALRFITVVEGREDRLSWLWRIAATSAAVENAPKTNEAGIEDEVTLFLPFAPGKAKILEQTGVSNVLALWMNDLVATVAVGEASGVKDGFIAEPVLSFDERTFSLRLTGADLSGKGVSLRWETWFAQARTEAEARAALLRHAADIADRLQIAPNDQEQSAFLNPLIEQSEKALMADDRIDKRGMDKVLYRAVPGQNSLHMAGTGTDTALAAVALLSRYYQTGDDATRRRARLLSRGVCEFQISEQESPHWGAIWDAFHHKKLYADKDGQPVLSVATTARAAKGLFVCHAHFETEILQRTALAAAQWLLLKTDRDGFIPAERFTAEGPPVDEHASQWMMAEALIPLVETFRANENEVFLRVAQRMMKAIQEGVASSTLAFEDASCELLAATVEGILMISREYESQEMITTARQIMLGLRVRRRPDGSLRELPHISLPSSLTPTLAGARAALALTRVDNDPQWLIFAIRALRAAAHKADAMRESGCPVNLADEATMLMLSTGILLSVAQRANNTQADRDRITVKRGWQTFAPDPALREYVSVTAPDGSPVDYLALVCPISLQVLIMAVTPPHIREVIITKNGRRPFVKGLLTGEFDMEARLSKLGDGSEAMVGVFLADT